MIRCSGNEHLSVLRHRPVPQLDASDRTDRADGTHHRAYAPRMRLLAATLTVLALAVVDAQAAPRYRLCNNPDRVYRVVAVDKVACGYALSFVVAYSREGGAPSRVWGWQCGAPRGGVFYGLAGSRTTCFKGRRHIRFDYRGE